MANYPVSVITDGMGLNITVMSYCGPMDFGIVADRDQMPDLSLLMGWLGEELEALKVDAAASWAPNGGIEGVRSERRRPWRARDAHDRQRTLTPYPSPLDARRLRRPRYRPARRRREVSASTSSRFVSLKISWRAPG